MKGIRVTVEDLESGQVESQEVKDDVLVITQGACYVAHVQDFPTKGTQVYTVKGRLGLGDAA